VESFDEKPRCLVLFEESCKSEITKKGYLFELKKFLGWAKMDYDQVLFLEKTELRIYSSQWGHSNLLFFLPRNTNVWSQ